jgi:dTDP-4-amino-4,6-dideoxygalactose transaminase
MIESAAILSAGAHRPCDTFFAVLIPFNDLRPLHVELSVEIDAAWRRVRDRGCFILGPELEAFEAAFAEYHGVGYAIGVASGTDAIEIALRAAGVGAGDEVVTVAHTAIATVCAIERAGAVPVLVDIDEVTFTMDPAAAAAAITPRTRALVPVHLYGQPADLTSLAALAARHHLCLIEDCAQAHGARHRGRRVGGWGDLAAFSFYPTKNLGALGDAGAVLTNDAAFAARARRLRNYGQAARYHHVEPGINSRLDEVQAAILAVKLPRLDAHNQARQRLASLYGQSLRGVSTPATRPGDEHVFHLYVVREHERDRLAAALAAAGIGTLVHYPVPAHLQPAYAHLGLAAGALPASERAAAEVLSLPLYIGLTDEAIDRVASAVAAASSATAAKAEASRA